MVPSQCNFKCFYIYICVCIPNVWLVRSNIPFVSVVKPWRCLPCRSHICSARWQRGLCLGCTVERVALNQPWPRAAESLCLPSPVSSPGSSPWPPCSLGCLQFFFFVFLLLIIFFSLTFISTVWLYHIRLSVRLLKVYVMFLKMTIFLISMK